LCRIVAGPPPRLSLHRRALYPALHATPHSGIFSLRKQILTTPSLHHGTQASQHQADKMLHLQNTQLALIHIPLELYSAFLQPLLQLLIPAELPDAESTRNGPHLSRTSSGALYEHPFINISVTPIECSIACSRDLANTLFAPIQEALPPDQRHAVSITRDDYVVMQVDGEGLDAGQRVLELTSPLAMAGISIFFITTYFSDYILVPLRARQTVITALQARGFAFEPSNYSQNGTAYSHRTTSSASSGLSMQAPSAPGTPPPATVSELQSRTFALLKRRNVVPTVDPSLRLVQCAARKFSSGGNASNSALNDRLHLALIRSLLSKPKFLSLTLTDTEPASLLLEQRLLPFFCIPQSPNNSNTSSTDDSLLLGSKTMILHPIILDLRTLPLESTGIVCGVAGRLVGGTKMGWMEAVEMSYLSTARAGTVMVAEEDTERAVMALRGWGSEMENGAPD
jgi:hypothetical protein